jgi:tetratricopeptide (TPR) repeat protein
MRVVLSCLLLLFAIGVSPAAVGAAEPSDADRQEAIEHYDHGLELARAGQYQQALDEFYAAYQKSPNYAVLYNIGQAYIALKQPVEAVRALEQYVEDGKTEVRPERLQRINKQIAAQRAELGVLRLAVNAPSASIELDGKPAGTVPLAEPLRVAAGTHLLAVSATGRATLVRSVTINRGEVVDLTVELAVLPVPPVTPAEAQPAKASATRPGPQAATAPVKDAAPAKEPSGVLRTLSYVLGAAGLALEATAIGHYVWNQQRFEHWKTEDQALHAERVAGDYAARQAANNELATSIDGAENVTVGLAAAGGVCLAGGVSLFFVSAGTKTRTASAEPSTFYLSARGVW